MEEVPSIIHRLAPILMDFTSTAFAVKDCKGTILDVNPAFCDLLGYTRAELIGQHHSLVTYPDDLAETEAVMARFATGEWKDHGWVKRYVTKDGRILRCRKKLTALPQEGGSPWLLLQIEDMTPEERTRAQFQAAMDCLPGMMAYWDKNLNNVFANKAYEDYFGKTPDQIQGRTLAELLGARLFEANLPYVQKALGGESVTFERTIPTATGLRNTVASYIPATQDGKVEGFYVFVTDNTQLKQAQLWLKTILDSAEGFAILSTDTQGHIWLFSRGAERLLGYSAEEILGTGTPCGFFDPDEVRARELELSSDLGTPVTGFQIFSSIKDRGKAERKTWTAIRKDGTRVAVSQQVGAVLSPEWDCTGFVFILRDITADLESRQELFDAMERAEVANQAKSRFLATMSHEIRTLLNGVLGIAQALAETSLTPEQTRYLETIQASGQSLLQIINDILDFSKVEAEKLELNPCPFSPQVLARTLESLFDLKAKEKGILFQVRTLGVPSGSVVADAQRLQQVLVNLVGNALKFTNKGRVDLELRFLPGEKRLEAEIRDTGIGMSEDQMGLLFQPFAQADRSTSQKFGGTGLGLAISKQLITLMGGEIRVQSRLGQGSTFHFSVPVEFVDVPPEQIFADHREEAPRLDGARILLVEDAPVNQVVAKALLEKAGAKVEVAENGREAVDRIQGSPSDFDMILMDVQMPEMNGLEATRILLEDPAFCTPVIALTAGALADEREQCREAGMVAFLSKPFNKMEMLKTIRSLL